jgi:TPR repeat protein
MKIDVKLRCRDCDIFLDPTVSQCGCGGNVDWWFNNPQLHTGGSWLRHWSKTAFDAGQYEKITSALSSIEPLLDQSDELHSLLAKARHLHADSLLTRAQERLKQKAFEEAIALCDEAKKVSPALSDVCDKLLETIHTTEQQVGLKEASSHHERGHWRKATSLCDELLLKYPNFDLAKELRGKSISAQVNDLLKRAREKYDSGNCDGTIELGNQVLQIIPGNTDAQVLIDKAQKQIVLRRRIIDALKAFNSGEFNKCIGLCDTLINEQGGDFNISLPDFQDTCSQLRDKAAQKIDKLKQLISDLETAKENTHLPTVINICQTILDDDPNNAFAKKELLWANIETAKNKMDWSTVISICQTTLADDPHNDLAKSELLSANDELWKAYEAEERKKQRRTWKLRIAGIIMFLLVCGVVNYRVYSTRKAEFSTALANHDLPRAARIAAKISRRHLNAAQFLEYYAARTNFESALKACDVDVLKQYARFSWNNVEGNQKRGETYNISNYYECKMAYDLALLQLEEIKKKANEGEKVKLITRVKKDLNDIVTMSLTKPFKTLLASFDSSARQAWQKAAESGMPEGQALFGLCCELGVGVQSNQTAALDYYRKAADQGNALAQNNLGICYANGDGVEKDPNEAIKWFRKAADQGYIRAQNNLGMCYYQGDGVVKDQREAIKWFRKAADKGYAVAQAMLGVCYYHGNGTVTDQREAVMWFRKAADQGNAFAQNALGICYEYGNGIGKDLGEAVIWYHKAADQGHADAQFSLGVCYANGNGVVKDQRQAVIWFRKAADQGNAFAQNFLGACYDKGEGVGQDQREAVNWFRKAADQGNALAQNNLGICYANGDGVAKDQSEAIKWFRKAADQGFAPAQCAMGWRYFEGSGVNKDASEAAIWFRKAAEQGNMEAQRLLGYMYFNGDGVSKNRSEAIKWTSKAAEQGDVAAKNNLKIYMSE